MYATTPNGHKLFILITPKLLCPIMHCLYMLFIFGKTGKMFVTLIADISFYSRCFLMFLQVSLGRNGKIRFEPVFKLISDCRAEFTTFRSVRLSHIAVILVCFEMFIYIFVLAYLLSFFFEEISIFIVLSTRERARNGRNL